MITLDMTKKADRVRILDNAFTLENGVLTLQISLGSYDLTGKTVTAAFSPNLVETGSLVVTNGVIAIPISPSLVAAGNNHIQLNIRTASTLEQSPIMLWQVGKSILATGTPSDDPGILGGILGDIAQAQIDIDALELGKVDKVAGKALSTNDFTDAFETKLTDLPLAADLTISLGTKVDKVTGKELSDNNYTDAEVLIVADVVNKVDKVAGYALSQNDFTDVLETKLNGIEALADVTDSANVSSVLHGATVKATPIDADTLAYTDTQALNVVKKATWANIKAFLKTYFDGVYQAAIAYTTENVANKKIVLTDNSDTFYPSQKAVKTEADRLQTQIIEKTSYGVITGLVTAQQTVAGMTVKVSAGTIYMLNGDRFTPLETASLAVTTADATNPRIDIVYVSSTGVVSYLAGTAGASPAQPATPAGGQLLATILVTAGKTSILTADITQRKKTLWSEDLITPTLLNSWVNFGTPYNDASFRKDAFGNVFLVGVVKSGTVGASTPIFTLPTGYRPTKQLAFATLANGALGFIAVTTSGNVAVMSGNNAWVSLDCIQFRL